MSTLRDLPLALVMSEDDAVVLVSLIFAEILVSEVVPCLLGLDFEVFWEAPWEYRVSNII